VERRATCGIGSFSQCFNRKIIFILSVPIFFISFPYALSLLGNLCHNDVASDKVDAFKIIRNICCT